MDRIIGAIAARLVQGLKNFARNVLIIIAIVAGFAGFRLASDAIDPDKYTTTVAEVLQVRPFTRTMQPRVRIRFEYKAQSGRVYRKSRNKNVDAVTDVVVGQRITVRYQDKNPAKVRIMSLGDPTLKVARRTPDATMHWSQFQFLMLGILSLSLLAMFVVVARSLKGVFQRLATQIQEADKVPQDAAARGGKGGGSDSEWMQTIARVEKEVLRRAGTLTAQMGAASTRRPSSAPAQTASRSATLQSAASDSSARYKPRAPKTSRRRKSVKQRAGWF